MRGVPYPEKPHPSPGRRLPAALDLSLWERSACSEDQRMDTQDLRDNARRAQQLETLDRLANRFGASLSGAFSKNVAEGRRLDGVLGTLGRTLLNASLRAAMKPLRSALQSALKSALSSDGEVTAFAKGGVVAAPTYFSLGSGAGLMGEAGAEAVMPLARGADGRLGVRGGGGRPVQVTVNVTTPDAESFRRSEAQVAATLARAVARGRRGL